VVQGLLLWPGDREWQVVASCGGGRLKLLALTVEQYIQVPAPARAASTRSRPPLNRALPAPSAA